MGNIYCHSLTGKVCVIVILVSSFPRILFQKRRLKECLCWMLVTDLYYNIIIVGKFV